MRIKIIVRKNLKMSSGKKAAQCVHAALGLKLKLIASIVIVLEVSDKKYYEIKETIKEIDDKGLTNLSTVIDSGLTEVEPGTETCFAYIDPLKIK